MDLRDAAFVDAKQVPDLFHRHVVGVVEEDHLLIPVRQRADGAGERGVALPALAHVVRLQFRRSRVLLRALLFLVRIRRGGDQAHSTHLQLHAAPAVQTDTEFVRYLHVVGSASQFRCQIAARALHLLLPPAQIARRPIHLPQTIQNGALDAVLGVAVEEHVLGPVIFGDGIEKAHDAGVDQVVEVHVNRQVLVHTNGNRLHQRKMVKYNLIPGNLIASLLGQFGRSACRHTGSAHVVVLF